jgi:hypothetical protein
MIQDARWNEIKVTQWRYRVQCNDPVRSAKNLSTTSKNASKAFPRCSVHFICNMEADGSSELLENFHHNIWRHMPEARVFLCPSVTLKCTVTKDTLRKVTARMGRNRDEIYLHVPIIKPTRCTSFSHLFLEWNSIYFGRFLCPSLGVFHCKHSNGLCHTVLLTVCEQDVPSWPCSQAVCKTVWHITLLCVQWKTPDDGQKNCPKHVEFHSKINLRN